MKFPVATDSVLIKGGRAVCRLANATVDIVCPGEVMFELLRRCDGQTPFAEIRRTLASRWSVHDLDKLVRMLEKQGVLVEASALALGVWQYVKNPRWSGPEPTVAELEQLLKETERQAAKKAAVSYRDAPGFPLRTLLKRRRSIRGFSDAPVSLSKISGLLWAAYGIQKQRSSKENGLVHRSVPSGGGLFPLQVHLVNLRTTPELGRGVYRVQFAKDGSVGLERLGNGIQDIYRAFDDPELLRHAQAAVTICGMFGRSARKYGNRAVLYVTLEAGHAAQNILLAASGFGLAAVEIGGFFENRLQACLEMGEEGVPLTTVVFGSRGDSRWAGKTDTRFVFQWCDVDRRDANLPFSLGMVRPAGATGGSDYCWGRDPDPLRAYDKAMAEAYERLGCETPRSLYFARFHDLRNPLDPRQLVAYDASQYKRPEFPFQPFSAKRSYAWKDGVEHFTGTRTPVLADCAYFCRSLPTRAQKTAYTGANTSGVAAHASREDAIEHAVRELIERDAFMTAWIGRLGSPEIARRSLPAATQNRIHALNRLGARIVVKDLTGALLPVVMVFAQDNANGITAVATAAHYAPEVALDHALMELEADLFARLRAGTPNRMSPGAVAAPGDHGDLYAQRRYFRRADFLAVCEGTLRLDRVGRHTARNWMELMSRIRRFHRKLVWLDLTPAGAGLDQGRTPLYVVRALVPGLVPISFGYGLEPLGLPEAQRLVRRNRKHALRRSSPFPHPYR